MKKIIISSFIYLSIFITISNYQNIHSAALKHSYDVLNYKLNLNIYNCFKPPYNNNFIATEQITFKVDSTLNSIYLDAWNGSLAIDSVKLVNGPDLVFTHNTNKLAISLNRIYYPNEIVNINIYYKHNTVNDSAFFVQNQIVFTDCEPEGARRWFPCWDKPSDKATTDITAKVPSNILLGSNGRLADSIRISDTIYYHWISRDPMSTYLVVIAGSGRYSLSLRYWHKISNPLDSIPVRIYCQNGVDPSRVKDSINFIANCFSQKFCEYPFEKIGFAGTDSVGNMENQTLIIVWNGGWTRNTASHEFGHHWFGDLITCGTWADVWLNESFGTYCQAIYDEYSNGINAYKNEISWDSNFYFNYNNNKPIYNPLFINYTPPKGQMFYELFNMATVYCKGACVIAMLRNILGDTTFFNFLSSYINDANFRFNSLTTDDFTAKLNQVTGQDYSWFIDEWIKQKNHPKYANTYGITNYGTFWRINFRTSQNLSYSPFHTMPVELKIYFHNHSDTLIKIFNNSNNQLFTFDFNKQPDSLKFDPDSKIILKQVTTTIGIKNISNEIPCKNELYQNYPNPFNPSTLIRFTIKDSKFVTLKVYDVIGREVKSLINERKPAGVYEVSWDAPDFPSGIYFYKITVGDFTEIKKMVLVK